MKWETIREFGGEYNVQLAAFKGYKRRQGSHAR